VQSEVSDAHLSIGGDDACDRATWNVQSAIGFGHKNARALDTADDWNSLWSNVVGSKENPPKPSLQGKTVTIEILHKEVPPRALAPT
jgi:hypothetical protein